MMKTIWCWVKQVWQHGYQPWLTLGQPARPANEADVGLVHPYAKVEHFSDGVLVERPHHGMDK
ncbi:hypothetical protein C5615_32150 [Burkholderia cepacia]|uniref:Uncharacterized protein n=1 Tax=Burkholderia cepacia TaxID=292 RepID=A0A2S8I9G1_BURCE|nr:hypothetical protein [Burkholderia cepacia]PQP11420.1 hypothetical protein C5615_32150 [Burkholderia cepacia]HDR9511009.1 hypothetical protein [Burkholderia cepacia]